MSLLFNFASIFIRTKNPLYSITFLGYQKCNVHISYSTGTSTFPDVYTYSCVCVCVRACVRACMRACVRACVHETKALIPVLAIMITYSYSYASSYFFKVCTIFEIACIDHYRSDVKLFLF